MAVPLESIVLNGSHGEGGGALLRTAVAMSSLTQQPTSIYSIRGALRKKGLIAEDLAFIDALGDATRAEVSGGGVGSDELVFTPKSLPRRLVGKYEVHGYEKGKSPGNALVLLTGMIPILGRAAGYSEVTIEGETHNENTVCYDAFERLTLAAMRRFGLYATSNLVTAGFGYAARGEVAVDVEPSALNPVEWASRGELVGVGCVVSTGEMPESASESAVAVVRDLGKHRGIEVEGEAVPMTSKTRGATITVWAEFENGFGGGTAALKREGTIEEAAESAFHRFFEWFSGDSTVDAFLADQLLLVALQAEGRTVFTTPVVTRRLLTMAWVVRQFMPIHITVLGREGEPGTVTIER